MVEQNQWLQQELERSQFMHRTDGECAQQLMLQKDAQNQSDFRAMMAELEWKQAEWAEERRVGAENSKMALQAMLHEKQKENEATI